MSTHHRTPRLPSRSQALFALAPAALLFAATVASAQDRAQYWLDACEQSRRSTPGVHCEVRDISLPASSELRIDGGPTGTVAVKGWDRSEVLVRAVVRATGANDVQAGKLASGIEVSTVGGEVRASGPEVERGREWSVSYEVFVPRRTNLVMESVNGGLEARGVEGRVNLATTNGAITLEEVAGDVRGRTTNGGLSVRLSGDRWQGAGLDLRTDNGTISLSVPDGYSARLVTGTTNGRITTELPLAAQAGSTRIEADLGGGGAPVQLHTTNGGVSIARG